MAELWVVICEAEIWALCPHVTSQMYLVPYDIWLHSYWLYLNDISFLCIEIAHADENCSRERQAPV